MTRIERLEYYRSVLLACADLSADHVAVAKRKLAQTDLFFLLVFICKRRDLNKDFFFARCNEVQAAPDGYIDLWAREHAKTSILTFGLTIQNILNDPEITVGIFSFSRPIAKAFLRQIKSEFERNDALKELFPDILWSDPKAQSPKWSEDEGIIVKRSSNPKESTVEAWGLVDAQPTSKHFRLMVYDDVVTRDSVTTPEMIRKVTEAWELSRNLTTDGGVSRYIGTRYHFNDTYHEIIARRAATPRIHKITKDGTLKGEPVLWTRQQVADKRREMGEYTFASQMLLDPTADNKQGFKADWLRYHQTTHDARGMNKYLLVDPATAKKKESDYTAMGVIGLAADGNYYLLDGVRDRLNLRERGDAVFSLHRRWRPDGVGYEQYGMQSDIQYLEERMADENYRFSITPLGGRVAKHDRIKGLVPIFEAGRFWLPEYLHKTDCEGKVVDLVQNFIEEEYKAFPVGMHEDFFDMLARIMDADLNVIWPRPEALPDRYATPKRKKRPASAWAA